MKSNNVSKLKIFSLIWAAHIFIYYLMFTLVIRIFDNNYEKFYLIILGFTGGLMGIYEQIPFFVIFPIVVVVLIIKATNKWHIAYMISVVSSYLINYVLLALNHKQKLLIFKDNDVDLLFFYHPQH